MAEKPYAYLILSPAPDYEIAIAEARRLTGGELASPRVVVAEGEADVSRSAYLGLCMRLLHHGASLEELLRWLDGAGLAAEGFAVAVEKRPRKFPLSARRAAWEIGARIGGSPNLSQPRVVFQLIVDEGAFYFGRVVGKNDTSWEERRHRPFTFSSAIDVRVARAMVNLVARPGEVILDPCCGSGTILCEARAVGVRAVGGDINWKMVFGARENTRYFGLRVPIVLCDARTIAGRFDAVVTNLPYGRWSAASGEFYERFAENLGRLAPRACLAAGEDLSPLFARHGWRVREKPRQLGHSLTRHIHVLERAGVGEG